jgi:hypothetical protein
MQGARLRAQEVRENRRNLQLGLEGSLEALNLLGNLTPVVGLDGAGDDGTRDTAGTAESGPVLDVNVRDVLVLAKEGKVKEDLEGLSVRSKDNKGSVTLVEGLGGLVGAAAELLQVSSLLDKVKDLQRQLVIGNGESTRVSHQRTREGRMAKEALKMRVGE